MKQAYRITWFLLHMMVALIVSNAPLHAQKTNLVYVDKLGVLRYTKDNKEAAFFGVNYTVPFAYGYRSHKALGADPEKAIDADVYHMHRLGLDAFRVHVWDTEITDTLGNLLQNDHLRLFDYLLLRLKQYHIKILVTPIAFWGNGYPQPDEHTPGFSFYYGKMKAVVLENAIKAQENYLRQFFQHVNPYTGLNYKDDPDIIAAEINNEPKHSGTKPFVTAYINRLAAAIRSTGFSKPLFYNISESPAYADAVAAADVQGHSFQWYPTGLVAGHELKGNMLPNVDSYTIPFIDTISAFRNKARIIYEFDAGDVLQSYMYPAIARSFRTAGFQWATQFAYDPMTTAYANTEYQTHYLNLAYTPSKAISLLIASRAFHLLPRGRSYGAYPADTSFGAFRVSYASQLSEMNSPEEFYYSNNTLSQPVAVNALQHIAGTGSSRLVQYTGSGAYFLDKQANGWRLEVMPDAMSLRDPFEKAAPSKEVTRVEWNRRSMELNLPGLKENFDVIPLDSIQRENADAQVGRSRANGKYINITPGIYLLTNNENLQVPAEKFYAPQPYSKKPFIRNLTAPSQTAGQPGSITVLAACVNAADQVFAELRHSTGLWKTLPLKPLQSGRFELQLPENFIQAGQLEYRILIKTLSGETLVFPGGFSGDPYAWDNVQHDTWQLSFIPKGEPIYLFEAQNDFNRLTWFNANYQQNHAYLVPQAAAAQSILFMQPAPSAQPVLGWQLYVADKLMSRQPLSSYHYLVVKGRAEGNSKQATIRLIMKNGAALSTTVAFQNNETEITIPLSQLRADSTLLLPRPYPGFQALWFKNSDSSQHEPAGIDKLQFIITPLSDVQNKTGLWLDAVYLKE